MDIARHVKECHVTHAARFQTSSMTWRAIYVSPYQLVYYLDLPAILPPGIFVSSADVVLQLGAMPTLSAGERERAAGGILALGHASAIEIGTGHGVFACEAGALAAMIQARMELASGAAESAAVETAESEAEAPAAAGAAAPTAAGEAAAAAAAGEAAGSSMPSTSAPVMPAARALSVKAATFAKAAAARAATVATATTPKISSNTLVAAAITPTTSSNTLTPTIPLSVAAAAATAAASATAAAELTPSACIECLRCLQKPTEAVMRAAGAVMSPPLEDGIRGSSGGEWVLTDSAFHIGNRTCAKLVRLAAAHWEELAGIEVDAYGRGSHSSTIQLNLSRLSH